MNRIRSFVAGLLATLALSASAHAADPAGSWPPPYIKPEPKYQELLSGWYLRADIGWRFNSVGSIQGSQPVTGQKYEDALSGSLGWGYKYRWFRAELSIDRGVPTKMSGTTAGISTQPQYSAKVGTFSAMANGYVDFGTWAGFTPYGGAGVGVTQLWSTTFNDTSQPGGVIGPNGLVTAQGKAINFSWALMGGVAYQVAPNWMVDVGYRYVSLGSVQSLDGAGTTNNAPVFKNLTAQEIRWGIRFLFD